MTSEEKDLLLKDLCARLSYGVKISIPELWTSEKKIEVLNEIFKGDDGEFRCNDSGMLIKYVKSYLFPLSSMTEEQKSYINGRWGVNEHFEFEIDPLWGEYFVDLSDAVEFINWCYENHFDINGLIPRGLAEDATDKNIY